MEKLCVIKRVLPHLLAADHVQRFREEAMMVVRLSHGNLVGVLDAGREEGQFYLAMDFVEGKDLLATWNQCAARRVPFPVEIAAYIIKELARGLAYAHAYRDLRLVHRDISPANVLLSYSGEVKLADFGLATSRLKEQQTAPGIIYGKLGYLAPEQARGLPLDGRTDLYSAGILLWEMLTGQQLFPSKLAAATPPPSGDGQASNSSRNALDRLKNPVVVPPSSLTGRVPPELEAIVLRALAPEPSQRYQTGEQLRAELASFLAKHAAETDAATLASFMTLLFQDQIGGERRDRDALMAEASPLLSDVAGSHVVGTDAAGTAARGAGAALAASVGSAEDADAKAPTGVVRPSPSGGPAMTTRRGRRVSDRVADAASDGNLQADAGGGADRPGGLDLNDLDRYATRTPDPEMNPHTGSNGSAGRSPGARANGAPTTEEGDGDAPPADQSGTAMAEEEDQRVASTIAGRYYLRRLCGEGAMGRVYEGHHVEIGRRVAIKILHSTFRNTPEVVERFRREARAASKIGHPNIVDVTDSGTTADGAFFFVMEYLDGVDLEQLIVREGPLSLERALLVAAQVCRALVAAHAAGIIHRDLKPANVMLIRHREEEDFVKVLDFGISKQSELDIDPRGRHVGLTRPDAAVGTPIYMAPEQVAGLPADGRTDVYAVGELLFEMLTGLSPYSGNDVIAVFNRKANEDPVPVRTLRPEIPIEVEQMLVQAMSRRAADRHETMAALKDEIMRCLTLNAAAPVARDSTRRTQTSPSLVKRDGWRPASLALWIAGTGAIVGLGVAAVVVLWKTDVHDRAGRAPIAQTDRSPSEATRASDRASAAAPAPSAPPPRATTATPTAPAANPAAWPGRTPPSSPAPAMSISPLAPATLASSGKSNRTSDTRGHKTGDLPLGKSTSRDSPSARHVSAVRAAPVPRRRDQAAPSKGAALALPTAASASASAALPAPRAQPTESSGSSAAAAPEALARGRAAFAKGNFVEALRLGKLAMGAGDSLGGHLLLGDSLYKMNRFAEAVAHYDAALNLSPANQQARRGREMAARHAQP